MWHRFAPSLLGLAIFILSTSGCRSPYYADQGALFGGLTGAGVGAIVGDAVGSPLAGAAIGAGVGSLTGAAVGSSLDEIEARNRAQIAAQLGRPVQAAPVTIEEVVAMTKGGVDDHLIITHVRSHGVARPLSSQDLIVLKQQGVSTAVIEIMQNPPPAVVASAPPPPSGPIIIEEYHWGPRYWPRHRHWHPCYRPPPHFHWGVSISSDHF